MLPDVLASANIRKTIKSSGFSLIELMIVVALIAILAAIGNFQYQKFIRKTRQIEAKIELSTGFVALKSFHAENDSYTICLKQAGYVPNIPNNNCGRNRYYLVGIQLSQFGTTACGPNGDKACGSYNFSASTPGVPCVWGSPAPCCNQGYVNGGGCNTGWTIAQSDYQYAANITETQYPVQSHLSSLGTFVTRDQFKLGAIGGISPSSAAGCMPSYLWYSTFDAWSIDENKKITNDYSCF